MLMTDLEPKREDIIRIARQAGEMLRAGLNKPHQVEYKSAIDPVTEMDRKSETFIIEQIRKQFPDHAIITEESGYLAGEDGSCWYVDPLDGTSNYSHGLPIFSVSIAYAHENQVQIGVIFDPMQDECFSAKRGKGAFMNERPLHVSDTSDLNRSLLVTGFPYDIRSAQETNLEHFSYFTLHSQAVRRLGSAALDLAYVAAGRLDGYWEISIHPWDIAAGSLLVEEAGGTVTNLQGESDYFKPPYALVAATPRIHDQILSGMQNGSGKVK
jgi:myo-inositol-1(or 4)-monophosphatase